MTEPHFPTRDKRSSSSLNSDSDAAVGLRALAEKVLRRPAYGPSVRTTDTVVGAMDRSLSLTDTERRELAEGVLRLLDQNAERLKLWQIEVADKTALHIELSALRTQLRQLPKFDLMTNYRCGASIEEMELSNEYGEWVKAADLDRILAGQGAQEQP